MKTHDLKQFNKGIGIDIIKISRIKINEKFVDHILSSNEKSLFQKIENKKEKQIFLAKYWAMKEAIFKAITTELSFNKIEILRESEKWFSIVDNKKIKISISHEKKYLIAAAIY